MPTTRTADRNYHALSRHSVGDHASHLTTPPASPASAASETAGLLRDEERWTRHQGLGVLASPATPGGPLGSEGRTTSERIRSAKQTIARNKEERERRGLSPTKAPGARDALAQPAAEGSPGRGAWRRHRNRTITAVNAVRDFNAQILDDGEEVKWWQDGKSKSEAEQDAKLRWLRCDKPACTYEGSTRKSLDPVDVLGSAWDKLDPREVHPWPLWTTTPEELGKIGGQGVRVYFELLGKLRWLFFWMALLNTPSIYMNLFDPDNMYDTEDMTVQYQTASSRTTLGSVWAQPADLDAGRNLSLFIRTALDGLSILVLLRFVLSWRGLQQKFAREADESMVTMADYTLSVRPETPWKDLAGKRFHRGDDEGASAGADDQEGQLKEKIVSELEEKLREMSSGEDGPTDGQVASSCHHGGKDVWLAFAERETIRLSKEKTAAMYELENALAKGYEDEWSEDSREDVRSVAAELKELNRKLADEREKGCEAVEAFVTFEYAKDKEDLIEEAARLAKDKKDLKVHGVKCELREATEPEALNWDRLQIQPPEQRWRERAVLAGTVVMLICGFAGVIYADIMKGNLNYLTSCRKEMTVEPTAPAGTLGYCDPFTMYGESLTDGLTEEGRQAQGHYHRAFHIMVERLGTDGQFPQAVNVRSDATAPITYPEDYECAVEDSRDMQGCCAENVSMTWRDAADAECHRIDTQTRTVAGPYGPEQRVGSWMYKYADRDSICYMCLCECENVLPGQPGYNASAPNCIPTLDDGYCDSYNEYQTHLKHFKMLATFVVVSINAGMKKVIVWTQPWMGKHSIGKDMGSTAFRVFLLQLLMTGVLVILLRADIPIMSMFPMEKFRNVCAKWYSAVGAPLIKTMFVNFCVPAMTHLAVHTRSWVTLALKIPHALTRNQRKKVCTSTTQDWNLAASYGELMLSMTVCLAYSSGIPVLLWIATCGFSIKFYVDKWCMLRVYQRPPLVDDVVFDMPRAFGGLFGIMSFALAVKGLFGIWLYATAGGIDPTHSYHAHLTRPHLIPYVASLVLAACIWLHQQCYGQPVKPPKGEERIIKESLRFSGEYEGRNLANEDPDYHMDQLEEEQGLEIAFGKALLAYADVSGAPKMPGELYGRILVSVWDGGDAAEEELEKQLRDKGCLDDWEGGLAESEEGVQKP